MESSHLVDYIKECVQRGYSLEDIHGYILSRGYDPKIVEQAFVESGYYTPQNLNSLYDLPEEDKYYSSDQTFYTPISQERPDNQFYEDFSEHLHHLTLEEAHDSYWLSQKPNAELLNKQPPQELQAPIPTKYPHFPPSQQPTSGPSPKTANFFVVVQIILLLIILVAGGLLGYYYYQFL